MDFLFNIIDTIKEFIFGHIKIFIIILVILFLVIGGFTAYSYYITSQAPKYPITSIEAVCEKTYKSGSELQVDDVRVLATHENGGVTSLSTDEYTLSSKWVKRTGAQTTITVKLKENEKITCNLTVDVERNKILGFPCGYPNVKNVTAVLYSNGELCFEGKGDVLISNDGEYLWNNYEEMDDYPITAVSFQDEVTPTNMNYWFRDCETLEYVDPIPSTVITMISTFEGCTSLSNMPDFSNTTQLLDMTACFKDCVSLITTNPIPKTANNISFIFNNCTELLSGADVSNADGVLNFSNAYEGCSKLSKVEIPKNATNISNAFTNCINLKEIKVIPVKVELMESTFEGCSSLTTVGIIPKSVTNMSSTFEGCQLLQYQIIINANPVEYSNCFSNAAVATSLNLAGDSAMLDVLANTNDTGNLKVFGNRPNPNLQSREDVFPS